MRFKERYNQRISKNKQFVLLISKKEELSGELKPYKTAKELLVLCSFTVADLMQGSQKIL
jgi:hypothetical protein